MSDGGALFCGVPQAGLSPHILLGHGAGGKLTQQLLQQVFYPAFSNPVLREATDSAVLSLPAGRLAFTTDGYVVNPLEFAGGNIGRLAVCGTINDLAMVGAAPIALSAAFILEEGLSIDVLKRVVLSMAEEAQAAGVAIVTGDTKVVEKGKGDGIFITTSGVGQCLWSQPIAPSRVVAGDVIILSGDVGRHAIAVQAARQGFVTSPPVLSDVACLHQPVRALFDNGVSPHCMRDLTRGGLGVALNEIAVQAGVGIEIFEASLPLIAGVKSVVEALGLDPLFLANEGRFVTLVAADEVERVLSCLRDTGHGIEPVVIGRCLDENNGRVVVLNDYGTRRYLRLPLHEPLPRIC